MAEWDLALERSWRWGKNGSRRKGLPRRRLSLEPLDQRCLLSLSPIISEIVASNNYGLTDSSGAASDWIEIYNPDPKTTVDLTGWTLNYKSNDWAFPSMSLGPGEFRVVFASSQNLTNPLGELHTSFNLDKDGANLRLKDSVGTTVNEYSPYPAQAQDISYGVGQEITETKLLADGATVRYFLPTSNSLGTTCRRP